MGEPTEMELVVSADGGVKRIYDESPDLWALGKLHIIRASHLEPDADGILVGRSGPFFWGGRCGGRSEAARRHAAGKEHYAASSFKTILSA